MIHSFIITVLANTLQPPAPPPATPFTQSVLLSGLVAGIVAGIISLIIAFLNHRNETRKWLREEKLTAYIKFLDCTREFIEETSLLFNDNVLSADERYRKFLNLKTNEIRLVGSKKVIEQYQLTMDELFEYWRLVKDEGLIASKHEDQVGKLGKALSSLRIAMREELQESETPSVRLWNWLVRNLIINPRDELKRHTTLTLTKNRRIRALRRNRRQRKRISRIRRKAVRKQRRGLAKASKPDA